MLAFLIAAHLLVPTCDQAIDAVRKAYAHPEQRVDYPEICDWALEVKNEELIAKCIDLDNACGFTAE